MTWTRHRSGWIWLAIATLAVVCVPRGQYIGAGAPYPNPVLQFLANHGDSDSLDALKLHHSYLSSAHKATGSAATWQAMLPVLFIGLVAPLSLVSPRFALSLCRTPSAPALPFSFQRPPPPFLS